MSLGFIINVADTVVSAPDIPVPTDTTSPIARDAILVAGLVAFNEKPTEGVVVNLADKVAVTLHLLLAVKKVPRLAVEVIVPKLEIVFITVVVKYGTAVGRVPSAVHVLNLAYSALCP